MIEDLKGQVVQPLFGYSRVNCFRVSHVLLKTGPYTNKIKLSVSGGPWWSEVAKLTNIMGPNAKDGSKVKFIDAVLVLAHIFEYNI